LISNALEVSARPRSGTANNLKWQQVVALLDSRAHAAARRWREERGLRHDRSPPSAI